MISYRNSRQAHGATWRDNLAEIQAYKQELATYGGQMSQYERGAAEREIKRMVDLHYGSIVQGLISEHQGSIAIYQDALKGVDKARAKEIMSWDAATLKAELDLVRMRMDQVLSEPDNAFDKGAGRAAAVRAIYEESIASGDRHKVRAAAEIVRGVASKGAGVDQDGRFVLTSLASDAKQRLAELRTSPEFDQAQEGVQVAWLALQAKGNEVAGLARVVGSDDGGAFAGGPLTRSLNRVTINQHGQPVILSENDPQVTGIGLYQVASMGE